jgi:bacteriocin-like protein
MLEKFLNLEGIETLSKKQLQTINGSYVWCCWYWASTCEGENCQEN